MQALRESHNPSAAVKQAARYDCIVSIIRSKAGDRCGSYRKLFDKVWNHCAFRG